jgi:hypothetical protein
MKRDTTSRQQQGFIKLMRSPESQELLLNDPLGFALLAVIAMRARWRSAFDVRGLTFGEALVGDYKKIGFTRKQYRTRLTRLAECGLVSTRPTPRGTIARLTSTDVFDLNLWSDECLTSHEPAKNRPLKRPTVSRGKNDSERPSKGPTKGQQGATN